MAKLYSGMRRRTSIPTRGFLRVARILFYVLLGVCASVSFGSTVRKAWGNDPSGNPVDLYTIREGGVELSVTNYGARIVAIRVPDRNGLVANVVLTREHPEQYAGGLASVMGATMGRYANRIAGAQVEIDGVQYPLSKNNGKNTLHGGSAAFHTKVWTGKATKNGVEMSLVSPDGDMGFPGQLTVHVTFELKTKKEGSASVVISYEATTTKDTVVNLTNHSFFNLSGDPDSSVLHDVARIDAETFTPVDQTGIPLGTLEPVAGTPMDFRTPRALGVAIPDRGYDHNYVLHSSSIDAVAAEVADPATGRTLRVYTTQPGMQLFVPHSVAQPGDINPSSPAAAPRFPAVQAFCLETQHFPDSPHHPNFPGTILLANQTFRSTTIYQFSAR